MRGFAYLKNVSTLTLDPEGCAGCGACTEVCPHQVLAMDGRKARILALDNCMECGACARNCPTGAVRVEAGVGCAAGLIAQWLRDRGAAAKSSCC
ncbi:MAG: 4Fe-4S dicluster domain-containing protein [Deltaproteobacteria bacterium]|nr:4Fe-4S dicluster domain-containing protein [Deltaproteobacteria bacterium]